MNTENLIKWISTTDGRLNRFGFIIILIINIIWWIIVSYLWSILFDPNSMRFETYNFFLKVPFIAFILIASVNRFHDMNKSGWFVLLQLLPIINLWILLWLIMWKWTKWKNLYGEQLEIK
jgi:uncharacterized membrane protein YhaH (DUF805 family)